jgi:hypothetical protein
MRLSQPPDRGLGFDRSGSQRLYFLRHLGSDFGKTGALGRRKIEHLHPLRFNAQLLKGSLNVLDFPSGFEISFQEMTFTFQSPGHVYAVSTTVESGQQVQDVHSTAARHLDHFYVARIIQPHGAGQIGRRVSTILATIRENLRFKGFIHGVSPMKL